MGSRNTYRVIFMLENSREYFILAGNLSLLLNYQIICHDLKKTYPLTVYFVDEASNNLLDPSLKVSDLLTDGINTIRLYPFMSKNDKIKT